MKNKWLIAVGAILLFSAVSAEEAQAVPAKKLTPENIGDQYLEAARQTDAWKGNIKGATYVANTLFNPPAPVSSMKKLSIEFTVRACRFEHKDWRRDPTNEALASKFQACAVHTPYSWIQGFRAGVAQQKRKRQ